MLIINWSNYCT